MNEKQLIAKLTAKLGRKPTRQERMTSLVMSALGSSQSEAKTAACRRNAKQPRPRKKP